MSGTAPARSTNSGTESAHQGRPCTLYGIVLLCEESDSLTEVKKAITLGGFRAEEGCRLLLGGGPTLEPPRMPLTVKIVRSQTRRVSEGLSPVPSVSETCTPETKGISTAIYVLDTQTDRFQYVAGAGDILALPETKASAVANREPYYRSGTFARDDFQTLQQAIDFCTDLNTRVQKLCNDYATVMNSFLNDGSPVTIETTNA